MDRHGDHPSIRMFHPHVTAFSPNDSEARFLQDTYEFIGFQYEQLCRQRATLLTAFHFFL